MKTLRTKMIIGAMGFLCVLGAPSLLADGTETLGTPSIPIQPGTGVIAAGTGLGGFSHSVTQPQPISFTVPAGATVKQVLLYWEGDNTGGQAPDNAITVNGASITGTLIGGPTLFYQDVVFATFRADITSLGLVHAGANNLSVEGMDNNYANNGAGVLVIIDDGSGLSNYGLVDGQDLAFWGFAPPLDAMVPQTFTFAASGAARTANLSLFCASAEGAANVLRITIGGVTTTFFNLFNNNSGPDWDTLVIPVTIPAGATSVTVEPVSPPLDGASLCWIAGALSPAAPCTGTIGDFVWRDVNKNGCQDAGEPGIPGVQVDLYTTCTPSSTTLIKSTTTDANGKYLFNNLCAGSYTVSFHTPAGYSHTVANAGCNVGGQPSDSTDSDCACTGTASPCNVCVTLPADNTTDLTIDCGYVPLCDLTLIKECVFPAGDCSGLKPIDSISLIWNGSGTIGIKAWKGSPGSSTLLATIDNIIPGQKVTVTGYAGSGNDVFWEIFNTTTAGAKIGTSTFHLSCSDEDMNGPEDCGKAEGDGKGKTGFINTWTFAGMAGNGKVIGCTAPGDNSSCTVDGGPMASCETSGKPTSLVFRYNGGGCANPDNNNPQSGKFTCSGSLGGAAQIYVYSNNKYAVSPQVVNVGEDFTVTGPFDAQSTFVLSNNVAGGAKETLSIHTSCSQRLEVGDVFGDLSLVGFNGKTGGASITYRYTVINNGGAVTGVVITDDKLGLIASKFNLAAGQTKVFEVPVVLSTTTTNTATATVQGQNCTASSGPVVVTVIHTPPPQPPFDCDGHIDELQMRWNGSQAIKVVAHYGAASAAVLATIDNVTPGTVVVVNGYTGSPNDVIWEIFQAGTSTKIGESQFHTSCSDSSMDGPEDCGSAQGNGKSNIATYINDWLFVGLTTKNGTKLTCP